MEPPPGVVGLTGGLARHTLRRRRAAACKDRVKLRKVARKI